MIPFNVTDRVFHLTYGDHHGTGFTVDMDGKQYFITARHIIENFENGQTITIKKDAGDLEFQPKLVGHAPGEIDITVLALPIRISDNLPLNPTMEGLTYGQDVYFLGFPYGSFGNVGKFGLGYPMPFVKRAIVSCSDSDVTRPLYLDGHNNPGFSGGPVVFWPQHVRNNFGEMRIAGVISAFQVSEEAVIRKGPQPEEFGLPAKERLVYEYNTGIIVAPKIIHATKIIRSNPIGCK